MAKLTWLGDSDPAAQLITMHGIRFIKGEPVNVSDKDAFDALKDNPTFSSEGNAEPAEADEPVNDPEAGTEKAALKTELRKLGEDVKGNPSVETLRGRLAALAAKAD